MAYNRPSDPKITVRLPAAVIEKMDARVKLERYARNRYAGAGTRSSVVRKALDLYLNPKLF